MTHIWRQRMPTWLQMSQADPRDDELLMPMCGGKNMHVLWSATYSTQVFWWVKCQQFPAGSRFPACLSSLLTYISTFHFALWRVEDKVLCAVGVFDLLRTLQVGEAVPRKPVQASTRLRRRASCVVTKVWKRFWERGAGGEKSHQD